MQDEDLRSREQRRVDLERRVLGGGADEHDVAGLHARQEGVLLCLVEAVDLVDEHDRAPAGAAPPVLGRGHHLFDLLDAGEHGAERHEARLRELGDHPGQRRLAGAGRTPEDDRLQHVALDGEAQRRAGRQDVFLADDVVERAGTHALGERCPAPDSRAAGAKPSSSGSPNRPLMCVAFAPRRRAARPPRRR
jgi:hypothetical protein